MPTLSPARLRLFRVVTVVLAPLVMLGALEGGLRILGVGHPTAFTIPCEVERRAAACPNPDFPLRFFPPALARQATPFVIPAEKGPRTVRVVVLGESAAQGDPGPSFGLGRFLQAMLEEAVPGARVEVVNAGLVAINSHALVPMARDLARHAPDVAVVYAGNNEVVGPFGPGTVLTGRPPGLALVRASLALGTTRHRPAARRGGTAGKGRAHRVAGDGALPRPPGPGRRPGDGPRSTRASPGILPTCWPRSGREALAWW